MSRIREYGIQNHSLQYLMVKSEKYFTDTTNFSMGSR
jgi:hypothetical protein